MTISPIRNTHIVLPSVNHFVDENLFAIVLGHFWAPKSKILLAMVINKPYHREFPIKIEKECLE